MADVVDYPDRNHNGIPDAFENRLPISQILNQVPVMPASKGRKSERNLLIQRIQCVSWTTLSTKRLRQVVAVINGE